MGVVRRLTALAAALTALAFATPGVASAAQTVVSLNFDDGWASQTAAASLLETHGMNGTFYVNSNTVGTADRLSWSQLAAINAQGNEIAGHTLDHVDLTAVDATEARRQVCDDRANIVAHGFVLQSFAYPYGEYNASVKTIVRECGYASGRAAFGLRNITATNDTRPYAGSIPPPDPYAVLTPCCIDSTTPLSSLQNYIVNAENRGGGWVPLVLHRVCDACGDSPGPSMSPSTLDAFLTWLQPRASNGTVVRTVGQVIAADTGAPVSSIACNGSPCSSAYSSPVTVTLAATDGGGSGVAAIRYTLDGSEPTVSSPLYSGPFTVSQTTSITYRAWDNVGNVEEAKSQVVAVELPPADTTPPSTSIACNGSSCSTGWYRTSVTITLSATDDASGVAFIRYTLDGSDPTGSSPVYTASFAVTQTTTIKYRAWDNAGNVESTKAQLVRVDTVAPTVQITSPVDGATVSGNVKITASAADAGSGVGIVSFYVDGTLIGTKTGAPYVAPWNTKKVSKGLHTLTAVAQDAAGNVTSSASVRVTVS